MVPIFYPEPVVFLIEFEACWLLCAITLRAVGSGDDLLDYLPESVFANIENSKEFVGVFTLDTWPSSLWQVLFCRRAPEAWRWGFDIGGGVLLNIPVELRLRLPDRRLVPRTFSSSAPSK